MQWSRVRKKRRDRETQIKERSHGRGGLESSICFGFGLAVCF